MRATRRVLFLIVVLCPISVLFAGGPASAHTGFESSYPVDGSTVGDPVDAVTIAFSGPAEPAGEGFLILDSSGSVRAPDVVRTDAEQQAWTLGFDPPLIDGVVGVRWTVQAPDAHPISGSFSFRVELADSPDGGDDSVGRIAEPRVRTNSMPTPDTEPETTNQRPPGEAASATRASNGLPAAGSDGSSSNTQDLEAFLQRNDQPVPKSGGVGAFGRLLGFVGTMLGIGGLSFGAVVVRNHRRDLRSVFKAVRYAALVVVAGTAIDLAAHLAVASKGWWEIFTAGAVTSATLSTFGLAVGLRMAAGSMLFATAHLGDQPARRLERSAPHRELVFAGNSTGVRGELTWEPQGDSQVDDRPSGDRVLTGEDRPSDLRLSRPVLLGGPVDGNGRLSAVAKRRPIPAASLVAIAVLLVSFTLDGHTVTEGNRLITGAVDIIHVVAASIWAGGVVAFAVVLWRRHRRRERLGGLEMALRFSVIAGAALAVAGIAGTILAAIILDSISQLWTTPWGRLLVAKTVAVAAAASLGAYNHFVVIPWMNANPDDDGRAVRIRNTATGEAILLLVVTVVTAFLVGASLQA